MAVKPSIPKGTRDFNPLEVNRRHYVMSVLRGAFEGFGFQPIETPSFENLDTLTGKYGEEGDRLIFKILRSGDFFSKLPEGLKSDFSPAKWTSHITDKALRYDLTVPFARYVVQHRNDLAFPFKRYQMQPVWRADRPQKGRFREFWQCDADVVGSDSLWQEVEFVQLYDQAFDKLGLDVEIHINNRKILAGIAEVIGAADRLTDFTVALDKLDKIGAEKVIEEMVERGIDADKAAQLKPLLAMQGSNTEVVAFLSDFLSQSEMGQQGLEELNFVVDQVDALGLKKSDLVVNLTLARGLDYYTGAILEVKAKGVELGSIGGGGRYDDLTGIFGMAGVSGMGVSFGLDRIYLCLEELNLFPKEVTKTSDVLFFNMGDEEMKVAQQWATKLRSKGISAECYPDAAKFKKQFDYAEKKGVRYTCIMGDREIAEGKAQLKDIVSGNQSMLTLDEMINQLK
ncbi:MAG: histidine--tRNA ligase [Flavobacteriia bacterium]|nr:histidine--tRNA ligase [Flavobacteriia bacterium]